MPALQSSVSPGLERLIIHSVPVFEFLCSSCGKKYAVLSGMTAEPDDDRCPHCGADPARKLVSRFARARNEDARIDELADRVETMGEPESPAEMRRMVREMGAAMDEDMSDEMEEMLEADMDGTLPDDE